MLDKIRGKFLLWEWLIPTILVGLSLMWGDTVLTCLPSLLHGVRSMVYGSLASLFGGLLGFVIAGVAILLTMGETPRLQLIQSSGMYKQILTIFTSTTRWLAIGTVVAIVGLVADKDPSSGTGASTLWWYAWILVWALVVGGLRLWRCLWVLENVIGLIAMDRQTKPKRVTPMPTTAANDPRRPLD